MSKNESANVETSTCDVPLLDARFRKRGDEAPRCDQRKHKMLVEIGAYRAAFARPKAMIGPQEERLGPARLWLLPQPSGLNANHQMPELTAAFRELYKEVV